MKDLCQIPKKSTVFVLQGEGIECEKEVHRYFKILGYKTTTVWIFDLLESANYIKHFKAGDLLVLPGGFSYSDHFGSGSLLAYKLAKFNFIEKFTSLGVSIFGICNGFQVLVKLKVFGENVQLIANKNSESMPGFINKWVNFSVNENSYKFPVRHGEGNLKINGQLNSSVEQLLCYNDDQFNNGSDHQIAGLYTKINNSYIWGMMPHPEIALRKMNDPNVPSVIYPPRNQNKLIEFNGDGISFAEYLFKGKIL